MENETNKKAKEDTKKSLPFDGKPVNCSFCKKSQDEVNKIIAGGDVFICDQCVDMCVQILEECSDPFESEYKDFLKDNEEDSPEIIEAKLRCVSALMEIPNVQIPSIAAILEGIRDMLERAEVGNN